MAIGATIMVLFCAQPFAWIVRKGIEERDNPEIIEQDTE